MSWLESRGMYPYFSYQLVYNTNLSGDALETPRSYIQRDVFHNGDEELTPFTTIEHYAGTGIEMVLVDNLYLNTAVKGGFYFLKNSSLVTEQNNQLVPYAARGFCWDVGLGIEYYF